MPALKRFPWVLLGLIWLLGGVGLSMLYSAGGGWQPWAWKQAVRFAMGSVAMVGIAIMPTRWWMASAWPLYGLLFALLVAVDAMGIIGMGAQRWINLGLFQLQPSETMKVAIIMVLARWFHRMPPARTQRTLTMLPPLLLILVPVGLVLAQPDLGTAAIIGACGVAMLFLCGVPLWKFAVCFAAGVAALPVAWEFGLHEYQRKRVRIFLDPASDPLGAGYHITQSKIALGSGGLTGHGFMKGPQSHLNFLPEKHTDFIFTMYGEEFGLMGTAFLLLVYMSIIGYGMLIALNCRHQFGRLMAMGLTVLFMLHAVINIGMVTGLLPVVGVPLPLMSYGGTSMITMMLAFGLIANAQVYRQVRE